MGSRIFLKTRYRALLGQADEGDHWAGGPARHKGATCPSCRIPLLLIWDLNAKDPRFPHGRFKPLERLPLYYCWSCVSDLSYRIVDNDHLSVSKSHDKREGPSYQYEPYPDHYPRRPLAFDADIPEVIRRIYKTWKSDSDPMWRKLTPKRRTILESFFGHSFNIPAFSQFHSQLGGAPTHRWWSEESTPCPFLKCPGRGNTPKSMRFLAGVLNDPLRGLPMVEPRVKKNVTYWNYHISVKFEICGSCHTVHASNRCD